MAFLAWSLVLVPGSVTLKNGQKLEGLRVEESPAAVVLHVEKGTITLSRKEVASVDAGAPAPAARPDRVTHKRGGFVEGVVTAQEKDVVRVRVRGGIAELDPAVVASVEKGGASVADLDASDAADRSGLAEADARRRAVLTAYAAYLGTGSSGNRGEAVPAAFGPEGGGGEEARFETALEDAAARASAFR
ncbi:MAG TPA: hypothetical protein VKF62_13860, partial [Planctomycetota bacterium]|nr:hypothetical protein [Planctomycetota bacterium]